MREKILLVFLKKELFRIKVMYLKQKKKNQKKNQKMNRKKTSQKKIKDGYKKMIKYIENESKGINYDLFKDYFDFLVPSALAKKSFETKNKNKSNRLVKLIKNRWSDLKDEIKKMSEDEKEIEKPDKILKIVEEVLDFNNKQNQIGEGLKILTPNQMLSRLPITLAQLKAGNNSEKLKNEIRQLFYSLQRSKKLTKQFYKNLVDII